jgi:hypothetical protein
VELDFQTLSVGAFSFYEFFFRYVNWREHKFEQDSRTHDYVVLSLDLIGMDNLWRIALEAKDTLVGLNSIAFLNNLHKNVRTL